MSDKPFSPSKARLAAAALKGFFPISNLLITGLVFLFASAFLYVAVNMEPDFSILKLKHILKLDADRIKEINEYYNYYYIFTLIIGSLILFISIFPAVFIAKRAKKKGLTAIPIPSEKLKRKREWITVIISSGLFFIIAVNIFIKYDFLFVNFSNDPLFAIKNIAGFISRLLFSASLIAIATSIMQISIYRIKLLKELSLTKSEAIREQILHEGTKHRW